MYELMDLRTGAIVATDMTQNCAMALVLRINAKAGRMVVLMHRKS